MSYLLLGGILCVLALLVAAAVVLAFVVRAERRHADATRGRPRLGDGAEGTKGRTGDVSVFLRFEGAGAAAMQALVARFAPHGVLPLDAVGEVARAVLAVLDDATHGGLVVAAYRVQPVQRPEPGGVIVCLRAQSRVPLTVVERSAHRKHLRALLQAIAALDVEEIVSGDLLTAEVTTDRAAPELRLLLGPHEAPPPRP